MKYSDVKLITMQISGNDDESGIATDISAGYEYVNGKRTENITHEG